DEHGAPRLVVELHGLPACERRGSDPEVDDHVEDRPAGADDIFRLTWRNLGEMYPADHAAAGDRAVCLRKPEAIADILEKLRTPEPLVKITPIVRIDPRSMGPGAIDPERVHLRLLCQRFASAKPGGGRIRARIQSWPGRGA